MNRFHFSALLVIGIFAASLSFLACKKDAAQDLQKVIPGTTVVADRAANHITFGVTLYDGVTPSKIVEIEQGTGTVMGAVSAYYEDPNGTIIPLDNLKGICLTGWGQYFLTTGTPANPTLGTTSIYNDALFKVDPFTGQCSFASTSPGNVGTVSDLEYHPLEGKFYGLRNNTNAIIEIENNNNNFGTYNGPFAISGIASGYTLKGLSLIRDGSTYLVGCATSANQQEPAKLYIVGINGGLAQFVTDLDPANELGAGHCAIGFDLDLNNLVVNRRATGWTTAIGLNDFPWAPPFGANTNTAFWGAHGLNFEDVTSSVY